MINLNGNWEQPDVVLYGWIIDNMVEALLHASPEIQKEITTEVQRRLERWGDPYDKRKYWDYSKAVDYASWHNGFGYGKLYVWFDSENKPFYVGQSKNLDRPSQYKYKTRSPEFQDKIKAGGCYVVLIGKNIRGDDIDELEKHMMDYLSWRGYNLVNQKDMPSESDRLMWTLFEKCADRKEVTKRLGEEALPLYAEWLRNKHWIEPMVELVESIRNEPWLGECASF